MDSRIRKLDAFVREYRDAQRNTVFLLEDGSRFVTKDSPLTYLIEHGVQTPRGRIAAWPHEIKGMDSLSLSLCQMIDDGIAAGGIELPDLESDAAM